MSKQSLDPAYLRQQIVGVDSTFETPFGERLMVYCDYTASGRCLRFVESYLQSLQRVYANTHTEDDITGRSMSQLLHEAEEAIKLSVNAGPNGRIVCCGTGATGAIDKLQQIIGVALAPATRQKIEELLDDPDSGYDVNSYRKLLAAKQPVVFIGPNRIILTRIFIPRRPSKSTPLSCPKCGVSLYIVTDNPLPRIMQQRQWHVCNHCNFEREIE